MSELEWLEKIRAEHCGRALLDRFRIEAVDRVQFWSVFSAEFAGHFDDEVMFDPRTLAEPERRADAARLREAQRSPIGADAWLIKEDDGKLAGMFLGAPYEPGEYMMHQSVVRPDLRRRGLYSAIVQRVIEYTAAAGYQELISGHTPSNNPVIIAKLKLGFRVTGLELKVGEGPTLWMRYFHDPARLKAYELRSGRIATDKRMIEASLGTLPQLARAIEDASGDRAAIVIGPDHER